MIAGVLFCSMDCCIILHIFLLISFSLSTYFPYGHEAYPSRGPWFGGDLFSFFAFNFRYSFFNAVSFLGLDYYCYYFTSHNKSMSLVPEGVQDYEGGGQGLGPSYTVMLTEVLTGTFLGIVSLPRGPSFNLAFLLLFLCFLTLHSFFLLLCTCCTRGK